MSPWDLDHPSAIGERDEAVLLRSGPTAGINQNVRHAYHSKIAVPAAPAPPAWFVVYDTPPDPPDSYPVPATPDASLLGDLPPPGSNANPVGAAKDMLALAIPVPAAILRSPLVAVPPSTCGTSSWLAGAIAGSPTSFSCR